jgi:hypothetical protein
MIGNIELLKQNEPLKMVERQIRRLAENSVVTSVWVEELTRKGVQNRSGQHERFIYPNK